MQNFRQAPLLIFIVTVFQFLLFSVSTVSAGAAITARYQTVASNKVVFFVKVGNPAPSNLIVTHTHSGKNSLLSSSPAATKINSRSGKAKWLLKNVKPGVYPFSLSFKNSVNPRNLGLIIRHREHATGTMRELRITP